MWLDKMLSLESYDRKVKSFGKMFNWIILGRMKSDLRDYVRKYKMYIRIYFM